MLIDTHCHLWWPSIRNNSEEIIRRAMKAGVEKIIVPGTDLESSQLSIALAKKYPGFLFAAVGIHPEEILNNAISSNSVEEIRKLITDNREWIVAVGEIGTDAKDERMKECMEDQQKLMQSQAQLALDFNLPIIIHTRNSFDETISVLNGLNQMPKGVFHCFSNDEVALQKALEIGFDVSYCGNISWSKRIKKLAKLTPLTRIHIETDAPFMTPEERRGEENEPSNVKIVAQIIAQTHEVSLPELEANLENNAKRLFGI